MEKLTGHELEVLKEAEDILFIRCDYGTKSIFYDAFTELYKALRSYYMSEKRDEECQNG